MRILAADVGGTKTLLALFVRSRDGFEEVRSQRYPSGAYRSLAPMIAEFLGDESDIDRAGIGVAGPVVNDTCRATNLPWELDARELERELGIERVRLVNDFAAVALGVRALSPNELEVLQERPVDPQGPVIVVGAGTGLGEAILVPGPQGEQVLSTEGGHAEFAPRNETEIALLRFLWKRHGGRISVERVVSGPGLASLYEFVVEQGLAATSESIRGRVRAEDPGEVIGEAALAESDPACMKAVDLFASAYGSETGDFALKILPTGGIYLAGGIAPRLAPRLRQGPFLDAFRAKGRMSPLLERMHVAIIQNTRVGLLGARTAALR